MSVCEVCVSVCDDVCCCVLLLCVGACCVSREFWSILGVVMHIAGFSRTGCARCSTAYVQHLFSPATGLCKTQTNLALPFAFRFHSNNLALSPTRSARPNRKGFPAWAPWVGAAAPRPRPRR